MTFRNPDDEITWKQALLWPWWELVIVYWKCYRFCWDSYYVCVLAYLRWRIERRKHRFPSPPP